MKKLNLTKSICVASFLGVIAMPTIAVEIEEIVVTAQKREQSLNDVGIAVTTFSGEDARKLGLAQPVDLASQTPNLNINETFGSGVANVSIRGIGLNDYAVNNNPAAGIYVDDVYLVSPAMLSFQLFDLERVEVLKGPQGTLYGKNTTAGTVKFISKKPTTETEGYVSMKYGRYDQLSMEGAVGGQLAPGLNARISGQATQQGDGVQFNRTTKTDVGEIDRSSIRLIMDWRPSDGFSATLNIHAGKDTSDTVLFNVDNILDPSDDAEFVNAFSSAGAGPNRQDVENTGASLTSEWTLSKEWSLTSVTGYEDYSRFYQEDRDGSALVHLDGFYENEIEQFSQELRATYVGDNLVLIAGMFYGTDDVNTRDQFNSVDLLPLFGLSGSTGVGNFYRQETDSTALFVHTEWSLNDSFKLNAGLRYTTDDKTFSNAATFIVTPDLETGGGAICPLLPKSDPRVTTVSDGFQITCFTPVTNQYDVSNVSGKIGLDYTGIEDTLIYASVSTGFKSGGFQGQMTFNPAKDLAGFDEENLIAYEVGLKSTLADNFQLNGALFFYDFEDIQFYGPLFDGAFGPLFGIVNAGDAEILGAEVDLTWLVTEGLAIKAGLGFLDTEITSVLPGIRVAQGSSLPNSPDFNFNFQINYQWNISDALDADALLSTSYKDDVSYDVVGLPEQPVETLEDGYWVTNVRIGISNANSWTAYLWGKNIADERYRTQVLASSVGFGESYGQPITYGIGFDYNF